MEILCDHKHQLVYSPSVEEPNVFNIDVFFIQGKFRRVHWFRLRRLHHGKCLNCILIHDVEPIIFFAEEIYSSFHNGILFFESNSWQIQPPSRPDVFWRFFIRLRLCKSFLASIWNADGAFSRSPRTHSVRTLKNMGFPPRVVILILGSVMRGNLFEPPICNVLFSVSHARSHCHQSMIDLVVYFRFITLSLFSRARRVHQ